MKSNNPGLQLRDYITTHENDPVGDRWEYEYAPHIAEVLEGLSKAQADEFALQIWDWPDFHLFWLAEEIVCLRNRNLDSDLLYIKMYARIANEEYLLCLTPNLTACIALHGINNIDLPLLEALKNNLLTCINSGTSNLEADCNLLELIMAEIESRGKQ